MKFSKVVTVLVVMFLLALPSVTGQDAGSGDSGGRTVEMMLIREGSRSSNRDQNMLALRQIGDLQGNAGEEIYTALERLLLSGYTYRSMANGRVVNDFPDVRQEAARQLGLLGTEQARGILLKACLTEPDSMVVYDIINTIGSMELQDNARTIATIVRVASWYHHSSLPPNNRVAIAAVNALESIAGRDGGLTDGGAFQYLFDVERGAYTPSVKERAREVLAALAG